MEVSTKPKVSKKIYPIHAVMACALKRWGLILRKEASILD
jgi:hypothetical protein